jgi:hypothetical protein
VPQRPKPNSSRHRLNNKASKSHRLSRLNRLNSNNLNLNRNRDSKANRFHRFDLVFLCREEEVAVDEVVHMFLLGTAGLVEIKRVVRQDKVDVVEEVIEEAGAT